MDPDNPCANCHPGPNGAGVPCPCPFTHMAFHETGTVFVDTRPGVPSSQLYKMVANAQHPKHKDKTGTYALASPDGFGNWCSCRSCRRSRALTPATSAGGALQMPASIPLESLLRFGSKVCCCMSALE